MVYLYVDKPVASLQLDLDTSGQAVSAIDPALGKFFSAGIVGGKLRIIIFGLNQSVFSGHFCIVDSSVRGISGVIGSNPDASDAWAMVTMLSSPSGLALTVR